MSSTASRTEVGTGRPQMWKFFVLSAIGIVMFFVPVTIGEHSASALEAAISILSVMRVAFAAITPRPMPGKM